MWSGPRNISTALMRAFENRPDTEVVDEPFYAAFLARSGIDHPLRAEVLAAYENDPAVVADALTRSGARRRAGFLPEAYDPPHAAGLSLAAGWAPAAMPS